MERDRKQELRRRRSRRGPDGTVANDLAGGADDVAVNGKILVVPGVLNLFRLPKEINLPMMVQDHHQEEVKL